MDQLRRLLPDNVGAKKFFVGGRKNEFDHPAHIPNDLSAGIVLIGSPPTR